MAPSRGRTHGTGTSDGERRRGGIAPRWRWRAPLVALALVLGTTGVAGAATAAPWVARPLPALHRVAGWVAAGLKDKAATPAIDAQLPGNLYGWIPQNQCLTTAIESTDATPCVLGDATAAATVVLVGDSSADQWALDLGTIGAAHHFRVVVYVHAACPVGAITVELAGQSPDPRCATFRTLVLADLAEMRPVPVLLVAAELRLSNYKSSSGAAIPNADWSAALTSTLETFEGDGMPVLLLHGVPVTTSDPAACIAAFQNTMTRCTTKRKDVDPSGYDAATWAGAHAAGAAGVAVTPLFCTAAACPVVSKGDVTHSEDNHVTERYAATVRSALQALLGCVVTQSFSHRGAAAALLRGLLGTSPTSAELSACRALPR